MTDAFRITDDRLPEPPGERRSKCRALAQQVRSIPAAHLELDHVMVSISAAELWKIFDEETAKLGITGLTFRADWYGHPRKDQGPPEDLTLWENVLKRVDVRLKSRFSVDVVIDPATGEPVEKAYYTPTGRNMPENPEGA